MPIDVWLLTKPTKSLTTDSTCAVETLLMLAMAEPTFCTSFGVWCFMISDAAFSPTAICNIAARSAPLPPLSLSAIARLPILHDLRHPFRSMRRHVLRGAHLLFVKSRLTELLPLTAGQPSRLAAVDAADDQ